MLRVNMIPVTMLRAQTCREHLRRWGVSIVVAIMALGVSYSVEWSRRIRATELRSRAAQLKDNVKQVRTQLKSVQAKANQVRQQIERARALRAKRSWSGMFAMLDSSMPDGCWLTSIATDPVSPPARTRVETARAVKKTAESQKQAVTIETPQKLRILGYASQPADTLAFVVNLEKQAVFSVVQLVTSESEPVLDGTYFKFEIVCEWPS